MVRTQIVLEKFHQEALRELARERGSSVSEVIREMIDHEIARSRTDRLRRAAEALRDTYLRDSELTAFDVIETEGMDDEG